MEEKLNAYVLARGIKSAVGVGVSFSNDQLNVLLSSHFKAANRWKEPEERGRGVLEKWKADSDILC